MRTMTPVSGPLRTTRQGVEITVWVVPGARQTEIVGLHGDALRIRVAQPPEKGKANRAVAALLSSVLGSPIELVAGGSSRRKRFLVPEADEAEVRSRLDL